VLTRPSDPRILQGPSSVAAESIIRAGDAEGHKPQQCAADVGSSQGYLPVGRDWMPRGGGSWALLSMKMITSTAPLHRNRMTNRGGGSWMKRMPSTTADHPTSGTVRREGAGWRRSHRGLNTSGCRCWITSRWLDFARCLLQHPQLRHLASSTPLLRLHGKDGARAANLPLWWKQPRLQCVEDRSVCLI